MDAAHFSTDTTNLTLSSHPPPGPFPTLDSPLLVSRLEAENASRSDLGRSHFRLFHELAMDEDDSNFGGPTNRMKKLSGATAALAEIEAFLVSGRWPNVLKRTALSLPCFSSA